MLLGRSVPQRRAIGISLTDSPPDEADRNLPPDFRAVFDASPQPLLLIEADAPKFTMLAVNTAHAMAFATTPEALTGWGVLEVFGPAPEPEAAEFRDAIQASFDAVLATRAPHQMSVRPYAVQTADGATVERYWSAINSPMLAADGTVTHIVSAVQDVTGEVMERRSEEARTLLMREVDHRARNALTIVQSIVRLTTATSLDDFRDVLDGRVAALARAQTSLAARRWEGAWLSEVVEAELASLAEPDRYQLAGPQVLLPAEHVQAVSMVLHELATNACKYGSLSTPDGTLCVSWPARREGFLRISWVEGGVTGLKPPKKQGFGSHLIAQLARQLGGEVCYDWQPTGLSAEFKLKLG